MWTPGNTKPSPLPTLQQAPLFLLFQPNFSHRDSGCSLPPSLLHLGSLAVIRSPYCAHFTVGRMRPRQTSHLLFAWAHSCWVFCLEAQALRAKRIDPGLRHWLSWEETSSEPSAVGSSQARAWPPSLSQRAWTGPGSPGSKCTRRKPPAASQWTFQTECC